MAAPTLETNAAADTLRITAGTSGDPVTFDDVWNWDDGGGSSGGDGDVPKDGGGTAKVNTFITEIVADAIYTVQKNLQFGNGSTSSYFRSVNEFVYFDDGFVFDIRNAATLQWGILTGSWGVDGSVWSVGPSGAMFVMVSQTTAVFKSYDSRLHVRTNKELYFFHGSVTLNKTTVHLTSSHFIMASSLASLDISDLYSHGGVYALRLDLAPDSMSGYHGHASNYGLFAQANAIATGVLFTNTSVADVATYGNVTLQLIDPISPPGVPLMISAGDVIQERYTVNVHVNDKDGADLESATVAVTSYGNIVSNDGGSTFYRCIESHTAGTFADDVAAGKWEVTTAANAAIAGVTGAAGAGAWVTGIAYIKAFGDFAVTTDANGDIAEQTVTRKKWAGTSEALLSYAPYTFVISKADYETLTLENIAVDAAVVWTQELQLPPSGPDTGPIHQRWVR